MKRVRFGPIGAAVLAALVASACQRTPEEPSPATSVTVLPLPPATRPPAPSAYVQLQVASGAASASPEPRCVKPTPATPPPPVPPGPAPGCPRDPQPTQAKLPVVDVSFPDTPGAALKVEVVSSEHDVERGLMYRKQMPEDHGMLFRLDRREHTFWMHNTCIPLDMFFVDDDGLVVGIVENAPTLDDAHRTVGCPSSWVLETNAGWARRHGVKAGQKLAIPVEARSP